MLGFWRPADPHQTGHQAFHGVLSASSFTAELFALAVDEWVATLTQPTLLVLDNASVHRAGCVQAKRRSGPHEGEHCCFCHPTRLNSIVLKSCGASASTTGCHPPPKKRRFRSCSLSPTYCDALAHQTTRLLLPDYLVASAWRFTWASRSKAKMSWPSCNAYPKNWA